ncbi:MAG TPA: Mor transcription activator family protein [Rubrivivax sp.]|nr:Mor transcription activator family protein [Rubrivivax sp.]
MPSSTSAQTTIHIGGRTRGRDEFLGHCAAIIDRALGAHGLQLPAVARIADAIIADMRSTFGGTTQYIARGRTCPEERAAELWARHREGESVADLARAYGYTQAWVHQQIQRETRRLAEVRKQADEAAKRQGKARHGNG